LTVSRNTFAKNTKCIWIPCMINRIVSKINVSCDTLYGRKPIKVFYLAFKSFDYERTRWSLFQIKGPMGTEFDIYVSIVKAEKYVMIRYERNDILIELNWKYLISSKDKVCQWLVATI
jgi:hypothetical protein